MKFWNGDPMTSADVVNALDYYRKPGSYVSTEIAPVKSITATGPTPSTVTLKNLLRAVERRDDRAVPDLREEVRR